MTQNEVNEAVGIWLNYDDSDFYNDDAARKLIKARITVREALRSGFRLIDRRSKEKRNVQMERITKFDEASERYKTELNDPEKVIQVLGDYESLIEDILEVLEELERNEINCEDACCYIYENIEQIMED